MRTKIMQSEGKSKLCLDMPGCPDAKTNDARLCRSVPPFVSFSLDKCKEKNKKQGDLMGFLSLFFSLTNIMERNTYLCDLN